jgi:hypothetical protein
MTMNKKFAAGYLLFVICYLLLPIFAHAQVSLFPDGYWGPLTSCVGSADQLPSPNPTGVKVCDSTCDFFSTSQRIIYFFMSLTLFVLGPVMIVAGGIMILISAGSSERLGTGKKMITGAVIGILITLGAFVIINTFLWALIELPKSAGIGGTTPTVTLPRPSGAFWEIQCTPNGTIPPPSKT